MPNPYTDGVVGKTVTWMSHSQGKHKEKTGKVIAALAPGEQLLKAVPAGTKNSQIMADNISTRARIVVEVPRGGKSVLNDYYSPYALSVKVVEG